MVAEFAVQTEGREETERGAAAGESREGFEEHFGHGKQPSRAEESDGKMLRSVLAVRKAVIGSSALEFESCARRRRNFW
eukprot:6186758-Pleurochrysis_carterae.AAC.3